MERKPQGLFAKNLKYLRKKQRLTQEEFASFVHVQRSVVGSWETERNAPDLGKVVRIAAFFGVTIDVLLTQDLKAQGGQQIAKENIGLAEPLNQHEFLSKLNERLYDCALASLAGADDDIEDTAEQIVLQSWAMVLKSNPELKQEVEALELLLKSLIHIKAKKFLKK